MRVLLKLIPVLLLTGCANQVFDDQQLASANAAQSVAVDACLARSRAGELTTMVQNIGCFTAARRQYFIAIKLTKMDLYDAYEVRTLGLAGRFDRHEVTMDQFKAEAVQISDDLTANVLIAYRAQANANERTALALQGLGAGLQQAAASMKQRDSIHCTSVKTGAFTNTDCN